MFSFRIRLVLKAQGEERIILVISTGFRLIFLAIAVIIYFALVTTSSLPLFHRTNVFPLILCGICFLASLYLERWIFDRRLNLFERNVGLMFFFKRRRQSLDELRRVLLSQYQRGYVKSTTPRERFGSGSRKRRMFSRVFVTLGVEDDQARIHRLDIASAVHLGEMRKNARGIADFCRIPLVDDTDSDYAEEV